MSSSEYKCLARVPYELRTETTCTAAEQCRAQTLASLKPHPELVEACAPLYSAITEIAHTTEACSPSGETNELVDEDIVNFYAVANAVRIEVAPLAARGELGEAATRVLDAIRFVDDLGRKGTVLGSALSTSAAGRLADTLDELATDPRLTDDDARAIARDLDVLLASSPRWDAVMRQEQATSAKTAPLMRTDMIPVLAILDAQAPGIQRVCSGTLRDCVEHLDEVHVEGAADFKEFAQRLGRRDSALAFVRMQIALRLAPPADCSNPARRRAILQPWADRAVVGEGRDPVVTPPAWQINPTDPPRLVPRALRCVHATI